LIAERTCRERVEGLPPPAGLGSGRLLAEGVGLEQVGNFEVDTFITL